MLQGLFKNIVVRNLIGLGALMAVHYASDKYSLLKRTGFNQASPYLFLLLLYAWIVFHNCVLFEKLYLRGKKLAYFCWTGLAMAISSFNMYYILKFAFKVDYTLPHILNFWVYTITGLGVYVLFKHVKLIPTANIPPVVHDQTDVEIKKHFTFIADGVTQNILHTDILFIESLENYIKINCFKKTHITRLSMKEAEAKLPRPMFTRISRSVIINVDLIKTIDGDNINVGQHTFRIGKVYKRYVEEQLLNKNIK